MRNREIVWGAAALFVGLFGAVGVVMLVRRPHGAPVTAAPVDAARDADVVPLAPVDPEPAFSEDDAVAPLPIPSPPPRHHREAGAKSEPTPHHDASPSSVVRATDLEMHPEGDDSLCVDLSSRHGVQLYPCHGGTNQRWTFAEDPSGAMSVSGEGGCLRPGDAEPSGGVALEVGACEGAARFRHLDDKRFRDLRSGKCVTARPVKKHARLVLEACDAAGTGQTWSLSH